MCSALTHLIARATIPYATLKMNGKDENAQLMFICASIFLSCRLFATITAVSDAGFTRVCCCNAWGGVSVIDVSSPYQKQPIKFVPAHYTDNPLALSVGFHWLAHALNRENLKISQLLTEPMQSMSVQFRSRWCHPIQSLWRRTQLCESSVR